MLWRVNLVSFLGSSGPSDVVNALHVRTHGTNSFFPDVAPSAQEVADEIDTTLTTLYRAMLTTSYSFNKIDVISVTDPNDPSEVPVGYTKVKNLAGTRTPIDSNLPAAVCGILKLSTASRGRSFHGRVWCPPLEERGAVTADRIDDPGAYATACKAFGDKILAGATGGSGWSVPWSSTWEAKFVIYSRRRHKLGIEPFTADITNVSFDRTFRYLRSRIR